MSSLIHEKAISMYSYLSAQYQHQSNTAVAVAVISTASLLGITRAAYHDYQIFMSYGPGGVPYNVFGWLLNILVLGPMTSETLSTSLYDDYEDRRSWLPDTVTQREGERPVVGPHCAPQRQMSQVPGKQIQKKLVAAFDAFYRRNGDVLKVSPSKLEKHTDAFFPSDESSSSPVEPLREIAHIHGTSDHSVHVTLSPVDSKKVILAGWGQRHPLDGSKMLKRLNGVVLPKQYLYIYAPRNDEEVESVMQIVGASVAYMTGKEVR